MKLFHYLLSIVVSIMLLAEMKDNRRLRVELADANSSISNLSWQIDSFTNETMQWLVPSNCTNSREEQYQLCISNLNNKE